METDAKESESACDIESELDGNKKADAMKKHYYTCYRSALWIIMQLFMDITV